MPKTMRRCSTEFKIPADKKQKRIKLMDFRSVYKKNVLRGAQETVCVLGLGFVGAAMSTAIASARDTEGQILYNVIGIDLPNDSGKKRVAQVDKGLFPFESNDELLKAKAMEAHLAENLCASVDVECLSLADIVVVDINLDIVFDGNNEAFLDLAPFKRSIESIGSRIKPETLVLIETTVPPGTCERIVLPILNSKFIERGIKTRPHLAHSYERVMPGKNYYNSIVNFWRVYSGVDEQSANMCEGFLSSVINTEEYPLSRLSRMTATETAKVLENAYRATNIAFIEEWSNFAETVGIDLFEVLDAIRMRPTHNNIRQPGFGVGGYCLTKDPLFAMLAAKELFDTNLEFPMSALAIDINRKMPLHSLEVLKKLLGGSVSGKHVLLLGVSYRQDVGDTRHSPSEVFVRAGENEGCTIDCQDPLVRHWPETGKSVKMDLPSPAGYDALVFAVSHNEYRQIDFKDWLSGCVPAVLDANDVLTKGQVADIGAAGCLFASVGRGL